MSTTASLIQIYEGFSDETRLRMLSLLNRGPLCVCHLQSILGEPQVKISKHLSYLRERGIVEVERYQNWMIYSLPKKPSVELGLNINCLKVCAENIAILKGDLRRLQTMRKELAWIESACCAPQRPLPKKSNRATKAL